MAEKTLVAVFSASGVTKKVGEKIAGIAGADFFEIVPKEIYTDADLNWMDKKSRSTVEMEDRSCRPAIGTKVDDMSQYDTVFVGFPMWWYREPSIIDTFMEAYDLSGKKVVPFATSGSSDIADSYKNLQALAPDAQVVKGKRFPADASQSSLGDWAREFI